jgi:hypothetical protein
MWLVCHITQSLTHYTHTTFSFLLESVVTHFTVVCLAVLTLEELFNSYEWGYWRATHNAKWGHSYLFNTFTSYYYQDVVEWIDDVKVVF